MRFRRLAVRNFRAIETFEVEGLTDFIVIAGPNGSGKSCVLDAIRLLKSTYGGYNTNEVMQWFGEFQIDVAKKESLRQMFRDPARPVVIDADIELARGEIAYLEEHARELVEPIFWRRVLGARYDEYGWQASAFATLYEQYGEQREVEIARDAGRLTAECRLPLHRVRLEVSPEQGVTTHPSFAMQVVFQTFAPESLGIIDYYGASRTYAREGHTASVNLSVDNQKIQMRDRYLYNSQAKFSNVKAELAATWVQDLIAREAVGAGEQPASDLNDTMKELFQTFFPEKRYLGVLPTPDGQLEFPVEIGDGLRHDINELSSGEKEVVYGYLRLRNANPGNSVILLDEPELHLNPALLRGFPDFYHRQIGRARNNQLWLVTHSDALLRQAVGNPAYSVYHLGLATARDAGSENQATAVVGHADLEAATISLVGDLATYKPNAKVLILEGGGDSEFDVSFVTRLFPWFAKRVNCVSGGDKSRVRGLYETLSAAASEAGLANKFYAITDRDGETAERSGAHSLSWDVYHIENYLLEPRFLDQVTSTVMGRPRDESGELVLSALREAAKATIPDLVGERLRSGINAEIRRSVDLGRPSRQDQEDRLLSALGGTWERLAALREKLTPLEVEGRASEIREELLSAIESESWRSDFPGRPILKEYVRTALGSRVEYGAFLNLVLERMAEAGFEPPGMARALASVHPLRPGDSV